MKKSALGRLAAIIVTFLALASPAPAFEIVGSTVVDGMPRTIIWKEPGETLASICEGVLGKAQAKACVKEVRRLSKAALPSENTMPQGAVEPGPTTDVVWLDDSLSVAVNTAHLVKQPEAPKAPSVEEQVRVAEVPLVVPAPKPTITMLVKAAEEDTTTPVQELAAVEVTPQPEPNPEPILALHECPDYVLEGPDYILSQADRLGQDNDDVECRLTDYQMAKLQAREEEARTTEAAVLPAVPEPKPVELAEQAEPASADESGEVTEMETTTSQSLGEGARAWIISNWLNQLPGGDDWAAYWFWFGVAALGVIAVWLLVRGGFYVRLLTLVALLPVLWILPRGEILLLIDAIVLCFLAVWHLLVSQERGEKKVGGEKQAATPPATATVFMTASAAENKWGQRTATKRGMMFSVASRLGPNAPTDSRLFVPYEQEQTGMDDAPHQKMRTPCSDVENPVVEVSGPAGMMNHIDHCPTCQQEVGTVFSCTFRKVDHPLPAPAKKAEAGGDKGEEAPPKLARGPSRDEVRTLGRMITLLQGQRALYTPAQLRLGYFFVPLPRDVFHAPAGATDVEITLLIALSEDGRLDLTPAEDFGRQPAPDAALIIQHLQVSSTFYSAVQKVVTALPLLRPDEHRKQFRGAIGSEVVANGKGREAAPVQEPRGTVVEAQDAPVVTESEERLVPRRPRRRGDEREFVFMGPSAERAVPDEHFVWRIGMVRRFPMPDGSVVEKGVPSAYQQLALVLTAPATALPGGGKTYTCRLPCCKEPFIITERLEQGSVVRTGGEFLDRHVVECHVIRTELGLPALHRQDQKPPAVEAVPPQEAEEVPSEVTGTAHEEPDPAVASSKTDEAEPPVHTHVNGAQTVVEGDQDAPPPASEWPDEASTMRH